MRLELLQRKSRDAILERGLLQDNLQDMPFWRASNKFCRRTGRLYNAGRAVCLLKRTASYGTIETGEFFYKVALANKNAL